MWIVIALLALQPPCSLDLAREAQAAYSNGNYTQAEAGFRRAADQGCSPAQTVATWSSLASTLRTQSKYAESELWFRKAVVIAERNLSPENPVLAQLLNSYALLDDELGRTTAAEQKFRQALARAHGNDTNIRGNLARLYAKTGRLDEAAQLQEQALRTNPNIAVAWINLAMIRRQQQRYGEAEQLLRKGLALSQQAAGEAHPETIAARSNLAQLMIARGNRKSAERMMRQNLTLWERTYDTRHPTYAKLLVNLAGLKTEQKEYSSAAPLYVEALEINRSTLGERHADVAAVLHALGALRYSQGDAVDAERLYRQSLDIFGDARARMDALASLAVLLQQLKRLDEASALYRELMMLIPMAIPSEEARLGRALGHYEQLLRQRREVVDAERVAMVAMRFRVRDAVRVERSTMLP